MRFPSAGIAAMALATSGTMPALAQKAEPVPAPESPTSLAETQQQPKTPSMLTGDWDGLRTRIRDAGIDLTAGYTSEFGANVAGGRRRDATESGQFTFGAKLDTDALVGLRGGALQVSITFRRGKDLDQTAGLQTLQQVQEVYGRGQTWRLTEFWYQQQLGHLDFKIGRLTQGADFASFTCTFQNLAFCGSPPGNIAGDYWYNWPVSQWGARLRYRRLNWYMMVGAYENDPRNLDNAFFLSRKGATGVLAPAEIGWTPHLGVRGLPGSYRIGGWVNSSNASDVLLGADRRPLPFSAFGPLDHDARWGAYLMLQQQLTGRFVDDPVNGPRTTHGLSVFLNVTCTDRATERVDSQIAAGLLYYGPLVIRPQDSLGFGVARTNVNGRAAFAEMLAVSGAERPHAEYELEFHYTLRLRPWIALRPNVQYIVHPGGYADLHDVTVLGLKSAVSF